MNIDEIDLKDWHDTKYLNHKPEHFISLNSPVRNMARLLAWITTNVSGRYSITSKYKEDRYRRDMEYIIGFENPADATSFSLFYK